MNRLRRFLIGRYGGSDQLNLFLFLFSVFLIILSAVFRMIDILPVVTLVLRIVSLVAILFAFFRILSKNIQRRQKENIAFTGALFRTKQFFKRIFVKPSDYHTHRRFRCPKCHQKVRVPRGKGKIAITCPKCHEKFIKKT